MSRHHHHDPAPPPCCSCCACACSPPAPPPCYYPAPPPQPAAGSDQLLHAIAAHLLLSTAPPPPPQPQPQAQPPPQPHPHPQPQPQPQHQPQPPPNPAAHHANLYASHAYQYQHQQQPGSAPHAAYPQPPAAAPAPPPQQHQHQQPNQPDHGQLLLHSLLRRVAALETTLPHVLPSHPAPYPHQPNLRRHHRAHAHQEDPRSRSPSPPPRRARRGPPTERELAARTIQEHFRRFLARRSRTLRQLKELAMLRSKAASLRASLSGSGRRRCKDPMAVSEAALGMLYRLDGIQGGDPMIREGKHAVSRELSRILEFVDKVLLREQEEMGVDGAFDDYPEGCHGMNRPTVNKKVSFRGNEANNEADESSESSSSADADETKAANSKKSANGKPGLAAPMPVHMESRRTGAEM